MDPPSARPASPLPPLERLAPATAEQSYPPSSPPAPIRSAADYNSDSDDELVYATPATSSKPRTRGHQPRPSTSRLLTDEPDAAKRIAAEREYSLGADGRLEEDGLESRTGAWGVLDSSKIFLRRNEGFLLIGLSQAFFASINTLIKLLQETIAVPVWEIIVVRMSVTWLACYLWMRWTKVEYPFLGPPGVRWLLCTRGVVGFGGLFGIYFSLRYLSLSDATVLTFLAPVLVGFLASVFLHESYSRAEALTGFASLGGVILIAKPSFLFPASTRDVVLGPGGIPVTPEQRTLAVGVAMIGVCGAAGAYLCIRKIGKRANALHSIAYFSFYSTVVSSLYPFFFDAPGILILEWRFFALIAPIGFMGFIAQALLTMGLQREKAGRGTLAVYSNLLFAMLLERIVFNKFPDAWSLLGSSIIIGGAVFVALDKGKNAKKEVDDGRKVGEGDEGKAEEGRLSGQEGEEGIVLLPALGGSGERRL